MRLEAFLHLCDALFGGSALSGRGLDGFERACAALLIHVKFHEQVIAIGVGIPGQPRAGHVKLRFRFIVKAEYGDVAILDAVDDGSQFERAGVSLCIIFRSHIV
jgi:hypothetical protein